MGKSKRKHRQREDKLSRKHLLERLEKLESYYRRGTFSQARTNEIPSPSLRTRASRSPISSSATRACRVGYSSRSRRRKSSSSVSATSDEEDGSASKRFRSRSPNYSAARTQSVTADTIRDWGGRRSRSSSVASDRHSVARIPSNTADTNTDAHNLNVVAPSPTGPVSEDVLEIENDVQLPMEVLEILGNDPSQKETSSPNLHAALASRWTSLAAFGLSKDEQNAFADTYTTPANCSALTAPALNPETRAILPSSIQAKDAAYVKFQSSLSNGIVALGRGLDIVLRENENFPTNCRENLLKNLSDAGKILVSFFHDLSISRRKFIFPYMNKNTKDILEQCPPTNLLFGSDLAEKVKAAKHIESSGKDLKASTPRSNPRTRPLLSTKRRGGGRQSQVQERRRSPLNRYRPTRQMRETGPKGNTSRFHARRSGNLNRKT
ncbi:uncharacterized protein LOC116166724 [Photinus pyralis]|uniref:uncharacterized protein LOC116166724 n=1 Tax=Photinus pyralis TaxID=7054 RepID=UPI0012676DBB|nr:uncharacterized protein LOC116166724 [Photinus pyralis]